MNNEIKIMQELVLKIVYDEYESNFKEPLEWDHSFTIQERNMQYLPIEPYKVKYGFSPIIKNGDSQLNKNSADQLRSCNHLQRTTIYTTHFGINM